MSQLRSVFALIGLLLVFTAAPARADILIKISDTAGDTATLRGTGNVYSSNFSFAGYTIAFDTSVSNYPGTATVGTLNSSLAFFPVSGSPAATLPDLTVSVQAVDGNDNLQTFTLPVAEAFTVSNLAQASTSTPTTLNYSGSALVNGTTAAPFTVALNGSAFGANTASQPVIGTNGYTLAQSFTISGLSSSVTQGTFTLSTTVSAPEPSSLVLTGLVTVGLGGVGVRRRLRARAA